MTTPNEIKGQQLVKSPSLKQSCGITALLMSYVQVMDCDDAYLRSDRRILHMVPFACDGVVVKDECACKFSP